MRLVVEHLDHRFGDVELFRDLSFVIEGPTSAAITGPSGVGKTTLLSLIGGLLTPTRGNIELVADRRVPSNGRHRPQLGWIFQTTNAFGNKTVHRNITAPLLLTNLDPDEADRRARQLTADVGLAERGTTKARRLSGGELQRLGIARALAAAPTLVLADEPTGQLDQRTSEEIADLLIANRPDDTTIIVVTHDPVVAQRCATEFAVTANGIERIR